MTILYYAGISHIINDKKTTSVILITYLKNTPKLV